MLPFGMYACHPAQVKVINNDPEQTGEDSVTSGFPKVYLCKDITAGNLVRIYEALGRPVKGKVAVKLSTGEPGGHNFLQSALIKDLVKRSTVRLGNAIPLTGADVRIPNLTLRQPKIMVLQP